MTFSRIAALAAVAAATLAVTEAPARAGLPPGCYATSTTVPGYVPGAHKGDLVFKYPLGGQGGITGMLQKLGLMRTHVGMMLDASKVRHDSMSKASLMSDLYTSVVPICSATAIIPNDIHLYASGLLSGGPGLHTDFLADEHDPDGGLEWSGNVTLMTVKADASSQQRAGKAADYLVSVNMGYSLYAYSQFWDALSANSASMCSGAMFLAWFATDSAHGGFSLTSVGQTPSDRYKLANDLYNALMDPTQGLYPQVYSSIENQTHSCLGDAKVSYSWPATTAISEQIVNTMAFNQPMNFISPKVETFGTGSSIKPDDLVSEGVTCIPVEGGISCGSLATRPYVVTDQIVTPVPTKTTVVVHCPL